jgi:NAD(P)-dependent dehydrogenase (short-subunit alcohol dehydrogenase family)
VTGLLENRVVLVSGGTQGVGAGVARAAAREGATVAVSGRRREPGEKLVAELRETGAPAMFVQADVAEVGQAQASVEARWHSALFDLPETTLIAISRRPSRRRDQQ